MALRFVLSAVAALGLTVTDAYGQFCPTCPGGTAGGYSLPYAAPPPVYGGFSNGCNGGAYGYSSGYSNGYGGYPGYAPQYVPGAYGAEPPRVREFYSPMYPDFPRPGVEIGFRLRRQPLYNYRPMRQRIFFR